MQQRASILALAVLLTPLLARTLHGHTGDGFNDPRSKIKENQGKDRTADGFNDPRSKIKENNGKDRTVDVNAMFGFNDKGGHIVWESHWDIVEEIKSEDLEFEAPQRNGSATGPKRQRKHRNPGSERPVREQPDFLLDDSHCYRKGQWAARSKHVKVIDYFCDEIEGRPYGPGDSVQLNALMPFGLQELGIYRILVNMTVKDGCEYEVKGSECGTELRKPVDECDTSSVQWKHGGWVENNCLIWRIDANRK